jgi:hypothetical protein
LNASASFNIHGLDPLVIVPVWLIIPAVSSRFMREAVVALSLAELAERHCLREGGGAPALAVSS